MKTLKYVPEGFNLQDPELLESQLRSLLEEEIETVEQLEEWLLKESEYKAAIQEILQRDMVAFQCRNNDPEAEERYKFNQEKIAPILKKYQALFDRAFYDHPLRSQLDEEKYGLFTKRKVNAIELFREENIPLFTEEQALIREYYKVTGSMTVEWEGEEKTLPQMTKYLKSSDREVRERAWQAVHERRLRDKAELDRIMDELVKLRHKIAGNAGLANYRDFMFKEYERFDYTPNDCSEFHDAVEKYVVPVVDRIQEAHQQELGLNEYKPWDTQAVPAGAQPLKPFDTAEQLVEGSVHILERVDREFADMLKAMDAGGTLDLESRKAKSPGGFCTYYPVSELSFIFMNASGSAGDVRTMIHEGGHAAHNLMMKDLELSLYRDIPMESAELASMSLELLTLHEWTEFYKTEEDFKRAKKEQLESIISFFPWAMTVDKFQHWLYLNPDHTAKERDEKFKEITLALNNHYIHWEGLDEELISRWKAQLHIYVVPFYYIEYAIAQLGALQMYRQSKQNPEQALANYKKALSLGSSKSLPEVYEAAGIRFDFSENMIKELMEFVAEELNALKSA